MPKAVTASPTAPRTAAPTLRPAAPPAHRMPPAHRPSQGRRFKTPIILAAVLLAIAGVVLLVTQAGGGGAVATHTYYVDASGSDTAKGTSPSAAWKTLDRASEATLHPGDRLLLRRGATFPGLLNLVGNGTATAPIMVGTYGPASGPPVLTGGSKVVNCLRINGDYVSVDSLAATGCGYAGFNVLGRHNSITNSQAYDMNVGIKISTGSAFGTFEHNTLTNNNVMTVLTQGVNCGTPQAYQCGDDSGATAFLINGDDNDIGFNTVSGSNAFSYDNLGRDGSAFEISNGSRNVIHDNISINNYALSEIGRSGQGVADGNVLRDNTATATCGASCTTAYGIILRGARDSFGPNPGTVIDGNTLTLPGADTRGITCFAGCPASTEITGNTITATRAIWIDGTGWTLRDNRVIGRSFAHIGDRTVTVPPDSSRVVGG